MTTGDAAFWSWAARLGLDEDGKKTARRTATRSWCPMLAAGAALVQAGARDSAASSDSVVRAGQPRDRPARQPVRRTNDGPHATHRSEIYGDGATIGTVRLSSSPDLTRVQLLRSRSLMPDWFLDEPMFDELLVDPLRFDELTFDELAFDEPRFDEPACRECCCLL